MANYTETVPFDLAVKLNDKGFDNSIYDEDYYYALDNICVTYDNFLGTGKIYKGDTFYYNSGENYHGKYIPAPNYAMVLDWLMENGWFLQTMLLDTNYYSFEFKPINKIINNRICCNGNWNSLAIVIEELIGTFPKLNIIEKE